MSTDPATGSGAARRQEEPRHVDVPLAARILHAWIPDAGDVAPARKPGADDETVRTAMLSNICRCTGYRGMLRAAARVRDAHRDPGVNGAPQQ